MGPYHVEVGIAAPVVYHSRPGYRWANYFARVGAMCPLFPPPEWAETPIERRSLVDVSVRASEPTDGILRVFFVRGSACGGSFSPFFGVGDGRIFEGEFFGFPFEVAVLGLPRRMVPVGELLKRPHNFTFAR